MKKLIILILFSLPFNTAACQNVSSNEISLRMTDWEAMNLKGCVQSIRNTAYEVVKRNGQVHKGEIVALNNPRDWISQHLITLGNVYIVFNKSGKIIKEKWYDSDNSLNVKRINKYNEEGQLLKTYHYDSEETLIATTKYKYDQSGNLIKWNTTSSSTYLNRIWRGTYDKEGNLLKKVGILH